MRVLLAAPPGLLGEALENMIGDVLPGASVARLSPEAGTSSIPSDPEIGLALIDLDWLGSRAISIISLCAAACPAARIVAVAEPGDAASIDQVLQAGATGYLPKNYSHTMMQSVLRLVLEGATYRPVLPPHSGAQSDSVFPELGLTPRQTEVLSLIAQGKQNEAIAKQLGITEGVVKLHTNAIYKALNVQTRTEAALMAARFGVVSPQQLRDAEDGKFSLDWLLPQMHHQSFKRNSTVFRSGDPGTQLYYLQRGKVRLVELSRDMEAGELFGEIAIFSPNHRRTSTALCMADSDVFSLDATQVRRIYASNAQFALYLVYLIARRLMADQQRHA